MAKFLEMEVNFTRCRVLSFRENVLELLFGGMPRTLVCIFEIPVGKRNNCVYEKGDVCEGHDAFTKFKSN